MPRFRRIIRQNALIHLIVRFLNYDYVLDSDEARAAYLQRIARYFAKSDWKLLSYALMSTHVHFGAITGADSLAKITKPLHCSFAHWLKNNDRRRWLGHVVASRPSSTELPLSAAPILIAYHHNNPVKAGVVDLASDSSWTSHRSYVRGETNEWLDSTLGLTLCEMSRSTADRKRFDEMVNERVGMELPDEDKEFEAHRRMTRVLLGSSVELGSPRYSSEGLHTDVFGPKDATLHPQWLGGLREVVRMVAKTSHISIEDICSKSRVRSVAKARRLFILCAHVELNRAIGEVASAVGITSQSARELEQRATTDERWQAAALAELLR